MSKTSQTCMFTLIHIYHFVYIYIYVYVHTYVNMRCWRMSEFLQILTLFMVKTTSCIALIFIFLVDKQPYCCLCILKNIHITYHLWYPHHGRWLDRSKYSQHSCVMYMFETTTLWQLNMTRLKHLYLPAWFEGFPAIHDRRVATP